MAISPRSQTSPAAGVPAPTEAPPRGALRLLTDATFGPFFVGKLLATMGIWIHNIAAAIVVFDLTRSATLVGAVSVAQFAPQFLLTPISGAHADRGDRRRQLIAGRLTSTLGSGGLAVYIVTVGLEGTAGAVAVIVAAFVVGVGFSIGGPALQALVPALVRRDELASAVALNSVPFTVARASGPALGAVLVTATDPAWAFTVAAATNLGFAAILTVIDLRDGQRKRPTDTSVRSGLRHVRSDTILVALLLGAATIGIGTDPVITLTPSLADTLGAGERLVGIMASVFGIGAGCGFIVLGAARRWLGLPRLATGGLLLLAVGFGALAWATVVPVALACLFLAGSGMTFSLTSFMTLIQERVPEALRGRVMALWSVAFLGSRPLAAGLNGAVADATSVRVALLVVTGILLAGAWLARPARVRWADGHAGTAPREEVLRRRTP